MKTRNIFRSVVVTLALSSLVSTVSAYDLGNPPHRWWPGDMPKSVTVDANGVGGGGYGTQATIDAIEAWNNTLPGTDILTAVSGDASGIYPGDGVSHVIFSDPFKVCNGTCLAATFTMIDEAQTGTCTGSQGTVNVARITDADVVFNPKPGIGGGPLASSWLVYGGACSNDYYIDTVAMHEAGHMIGLLHSGAAAALMYPSVAACDNKTIWTDDENGRDALYDCTFAEGPAPVCGDGQVTGGEVCDTNDLATSTADCADVLGPEYSGTATCAAGCNGYDTAGCTLNCSPTESPGELTCNDGLDNDCDLAVDCTDSDCSSDPACSTDGLPKGVECTSDDQCASGKCRGRTGAQTCK